MAFYDGLLHEDEQVIRVIHSHPVAFFWSIAWSLLFICSAAFFMIPLFGMGRIGISVFGLLVIVGVYLGIRVITMVRHNSFIITDYRLIDWDQRGLFDQEISEAALDEIYDVSHRIKGALHTAAHVGSVRVQAQEGDVTLILYGTKDPQEVQNYINDLRNSLE